MYGHHESPSSVFARRPLPSGILAQPGPASPFPSRPIPPSRLGSRRRNLPGHFGVENSEGRSRTWFPIFEGALFFRPRPRTAICPSVQRSARRSRLSTTRLIFGLHALAATSLFCSPSSTTPSAMTSSHERLPYWDMDSLLNAPLAKVVIPPIRPLRAWNPLRIGTAEVRATRGPARDVAVPDERIRDSQAVQPAGCGPPGRCAGSSGGHRLDR